MLTLPEILSRLNALPEKFERDFTGGMWCMAAMDYENAVITSRLIRMEDAAREKLLGKFDQEKVERAYKEAGWWRVERERDRKQAV